MQQLAKPQSGIDDLKGKFARPVSDIPGVTGKATGADARQGQSDNTPIPFNKE